MPEVFKDIDGYEGLYKVSDAGRVYSSRSERFLKPQRVAHGYLQVHLCKNGGVKNELVHRLVALAFLPSQDGKTEVNHKNEMKDDNRASNLEWATRKENINYGSRTSKYEKPVTCIETGETYRSIADASRKTGAREKKIQDACAGRIKMTAGMHWRYADHRICGENRDCGIC